MFAQKEKSIKGSLRGPYNELVTDASVLLKNQTGEIEAYTISDEQGNFLIVTPYRGNFTLQISHLLFNSASKKIVLTEAETVYKFDFHLLIKSNQLDEVVLQGQRAAAQLSGDTLRYNIGAFTNGGEEKLKDIINKLPGLEIDGNGKIRSEGKIIDHLLVNGKPFFGDNHKIAVENLGAKMVESVEILKNYETFSALKEIGTSNKTALNIDIKDKYQGKPTGDVEAFGAYDERYKLHSNLFLFSKATNISFIGDFNNTGQKPLSPIDFVLMDKSRKIMNEDDQKSSLKKSSDLPDFLFDNNNNNTDYRSGFGALNTVFTVSKNLSVEAFSIVNKERLAGRQFSERQFFSQNETILSEESIIDNNTALVNQTNINAEYKPSDKSLWTFDLDYRPKNDAYDTAINGTIASEEQITTQQIKNNGHSVSQNLGYSTLLAKKKLLSLNMYSVNVKESTKLNLNANRPLFELGNQINQELIEKEKTFGLFAKYVERFNKHLVKFNLGYHWNEGIFSERGISEENVANPRQNYFFIGFLLEKTEGFFQYELLANSRKYQTKFSEISNLDWFFLPSLKGKFVFSKTHYLSLDYARQVGFGNARQLNPFSYAIDYRNFRSNSEVLFEKPILNNRFSLQYSYFNLFSGTQLFLNSSYNKTENRIGFNNELSGIFNFSNMFNTPTNSIWANTFRFQTRINPIKTAFKLEFDYTRVLDNNTINNQINEAINNQYRIKPSLLSYFKDSWINYDLGIDFQLNKTQFALTNLENQIIRTTGFLNLNGTFAKKWDYEINNALNYYKASEISRNIHQLDFKLKYTNSTSSKFSFWVSGENMLNLSNVSIVDAVVLENSISTNVILQLPGYLGLGATYRF